MAPRRHFRWNKGARRVRPARRLQVECLETRNLLSVAINEFPIPTPDSAPVGITTGPDGNLWFTEIGVGKIGQINPTTHAFAEFPIPTPFSVPSDITTGPDGNLWFTEIGVGKIGQIIAAGPTVLAVQRFGFHSRPTSLVLTFNEPLNSITAENTASYTIVGPHGRGVAVNAAVYDPATQTVTLTPSRRLNLHHTYRLIVNGTGPNAVLDTLGLPLNATGFGRPGSDFVTTVTIANWVRPLHRLSVRHRR
jgi:Bacterial Ig-like domain